MRNASLWRGLLGVEKAVVECIEYDEDEQLLVALVRPRKGARRRCGRCRRRCPSYDQGSRRRWRALDLGTVPVYLEADAPRVACPEHGVIVAHVPWARHGAGHTHRFDQQVAWLATQCSKTAICELMRIAWRTVGAILARVWDDTAAEYDPFAGLARIGIDEISYKHGHKYLTVVVDHDTGRLVWAAPGRDKATLRGFFDALEASAAGRCDRITHVSADGADWIETVVAERCKKAVLCADPFHIVAWAIDALDEVRRQAWRDARKAGHTVGYGSQDGRKRRISSGPARALVRARYALWKNPDNLTDNQRAKLEWIAKTDPASTAPTCSKKASAPSSNSPPSRPPRRWTAGSAGPADPASNPSSNSNAASSNTDPRSSPQSSTACPTDASKPSTPRSDSSPHIAFGFASPHALIALAMLHLGGHKPTLPDRQ